MDMSPNVRPRDPTCWSIFSRKPSGAIISSLISEPILPWILYPPLVVDIGSYCPLVPGDTGDNYTRGMLEFNQSRLFQ